MRRSHHPKPGTCRVCSRGLPPPAARQHQCFPSRGSRAECRGLVANTDHRDRHALALSHRCHVAWVAAALDGRAATWEDGFPTREAVRDLFSADRPETAPAQPATHVMPMWERAVAPEESRSPSPDRAPARSARHATTDAADPLKSTAQRRVADPFNAQDDGANCLRCGYVIEPERDQRGLMTCAACGSTEAGPASRPIASRTTTEVSRIQTVRSRAAWNQSRRLRSTLSCMLRGPSEEPFCSDRLQRIQLLIVGFYSCFWAS